MQCLPYELKDSCRFSQKFISVDYIKGEANVVSEEMT